MGSSRLVGADRLRRASGERSGGGGFELGGVGTVAALPVVIAQMSPEVNGSAVHVVAAA
jgi:hypothetical protein